MSLVTRVSVAFLMALAPAWRVLLHPVLPRGLRLRLGAGPGAGGDPGLLPRGPRGPDRPRGLGDLRRGGTEGRVHAGRRAADGPRDRPRDLGPLAWTLRRRPKGPTACAGGCSCGERSAADIPRGPHEPKGKEHRPRPAGAGRAQRRRAGPRAPVSCTGRVGLDRAGGGRDPMVGGHPAADLAGTVGGRWPRRSDAARPGAPCPADPHGRVSSARCPSTTAGCRTRGRAMSPRTSPAASTGLLDRLHVTLERQRQFTGQASHQFLHPADRRADRRDRGRPPPPPRTVEEH